MAVNRRSNIVGPNDIWALWGQPCRSALEEQAPRCSACAATADVCREHGISSATFYKWEPKYGGLEVSDARRLKALEDENAKLKKLLAEAMLDNATLKDVASKKW
jgi:putative transposase